MSSENKDSVVTIHFTIEFNLENLKKLVSDNLPFLTAKIFEAISSKKGKQDAKSD